MPKALNLKIGSVWGDLTIISSPEPYYTKGNKFHGFKQLCQCVCGYKSEYSSSFLKRGISKRCIRCANKNKIKTVLKIGDSFGKLIVIDDLIFYKTDGKNTKRICYKCSCLCGDINYYRLIHLTSKKSTSCKHCAYKKRPQSTERLTNEERLYNLSIVSRCKNTKINNSLKIEDFCKIIYKNCHYCGEPPRELTYLNHNTIVKRGSMFANGIDRIDSSEGYYVGNCVPCCKKCNIMKTNMSVEEFRSQIIKLYEIWIKPEDTIKEK